MNLIDLKNKSLRENDRCDLNVNIEDYTIKIWSIPLLFGDSPFDEKLVKNKFKDSLDSILPYLCGGGYYLLERNGLVQEIATDYYAHARVYYTIVDDELNISEDWRILPHKTSELNVFQTLYFLNWDSCFNGETFFKDLLYFTPTYLYSITDRGIEKKYIPFPDMKSNSLFESISRTLNALSASKDTMGIMLSGGTDSAQIALAAQSIGCRLNYLCAHINDFDMYDNKQDEIGASVFAKELGLKFEVIDVTITNFLQGWNNQLLKHVAFSYKDGRLWQGIASEASKRGYSLLIDGQNADALYNYSYTGESEYDILMRSLTTDEMIENVFETKYEERVVEAWEKYNECEIDEESFVAWVIVKGNGYKNYKGLAVDKAATKETDALYEKELKRRMKEMIDLYKTNQVRSSRHLLLECKMVGYIDGEDTRCISGACTSNGIRCLHLYTTPLVLDALLKLRITEEDITQAKRVSKSNCSKHKSYLDAQKAKMNVKRDNTYSASEVWNIVYGILNNRFNFTAFEKKALEIFEEYNLFEHNKLEELMHADIGIKLRVAWFGMIYDTYSKNNRKIKIP